MIVVVGAGVSGLTCSLRLLEAGYDVQTWAAARGLDLVSSVAAALWYPLRRDLDPESSVRRLAVSYERFVALAEDPAAGVVLRDGIELFRDEVPAEDWWTGTPSFARGARDGVATVEWRALPVIEMPVYLEWLEGGVARLGGRFVARTLRTLDEALDAADLVVNCSGLGARDLCGDDAMFPVRGQVVRVAPCGIDRFVLDEQNPAGPVYIIPRAHDVVLGGVREAGDWSADVRADTARAIVERCAELEPRVRDAEIVSQAAGLRPGRDRVRLEAEERGEKAIVHDYGHSGSGVTLSWGCAEEVLSLVRARLH